MVTRIKYLLVFTLTMATTIFAEETPTPAELYQDYCSVCHGDGGQGAIWTAAGLSPIPADFTNPQTWLILKNRDRMISSVTYGVPQTAMAGWGSRISTENIEIIVDYVRNTFMRLDLIPDYENKGNSMDMAGMNNSEEHDHDAHGAVELNMPLPNNLKGDLFRGESLYNATCAECHGEIGDGKGPRAYFIFPKPRSFLDPAPRATYSKSHIFESTAKGVYGTEMPAWDKVFGEQELADVSEYLFEAFIAPNNPHVKAMPKMNMDAGSARADDGHTDHTH